MKKYEYEISFYWPDFIRNYDKVLVDKSKNGWYLATTHLPGNRYKCQDYMRFENGKLVEPIEMIQDLQNGVFDYVLKQESEHHVSDKFKVKWDILAERIFNRSCAFYEDGCYGSHVEVRDCFNALRETMSEMEDMMNIWETESKSNG